MRGRIMNKLQTNLTVRPEKCGRRSLIVIVSQMPTG